MISIKITGIVRDNKGRIKGYNTIDENNMSCYMSSSAIKSAIKNKQVYLINGELTDTGRIGIAY